MSGPGCAVVIGVGPGLGRALCLAFAREGMAVLAASRSGAMPPDLPADIAGRIAPVACDATDAGDVARVFDAATAEGGPRVAVFNASRRHLGTVLDMDPADFEDSWRTGCYAGFLFGRAAAKAMMQRGGGTILFTGATASLRGGARFADFAAAKFGLRALAQSMARELGPVGIHVAHIVIDGQILSPRYADLAKERGEETFLHPEQIAAQYVMLHRQDRTTWTHELDLRPFGERF